MQTGGEKAESCWLHNLLWLDNFFPEDRGIKIIFETLKNQTDFRNLTKKGHRINTKYFKLIILTPDIGVNKIRLGLVINKKTGKAVLRNTVKRRIKEIFRNISKTSNTGIDVLLIAKKEISNLSFNELREKILDSTGKYI